MRRIFWWYKKLRIGNDEESAFINRLKMLNLMDNGMWFLSLLRHIIVCHYLHRLNFATSTFAVPWFEPVSKVLIVLYGTLRKKLYSTGVQLIKRMVNGTSHIIKSNNENLKNDRSYESSVLTSCQRYWKIKIATFYPQYDCFIKQTIIHKEICFSGEQLRS